MSRWEPSLRELAMEPDEDRRLEMAADLDREAADLDERFGNRDEYSRMEAERDRVAAERDDAYAERDRYRERYVNRFFDSGEGKTDRDEIVDDQNDDTRKDGEARGFAALWADRES